MREGQTIENATAEFINQLNARCSEATLNIISTKDDGGNRTFMLEYFNVSETIDGALDAVGAELARATFGDIELSEAVKTAAAQASAEFDERVAQTQSAKTWKKVLGSLLPTKKQLENPGWQLAMTLAAAQDSSNKGNIKVTMIPTTTDDPMERAAQVVSANLNNGAQS